MLTSGLKAFQMAEDLTLEKVKKSKGPANKRSGKEAADYFETIYRGLLGVRENSCPQQTAEEPKAERRRAAPPNKNHFVAEAGLLFALLLFAFLTFKHLTGRIKGKIKSAHEMNMASPKL